MAGAGRGRIFRKLRTDMWTLLYLEQITDKDLLYSTWHSAQCQWQPKLEGSLGAGWIQVCVWMSPAAAYLKLTHQWLLTSYASVVAQLCLTLTPCTAALCPWDSPGKNTRVGSHSLLQGIFSTQGLTPGLWHHRQIFYHLNYQGRP